MGINLKLVEEKTSAYLDKARISLEAEGVKVINSYTGR